MTRRILLRLLALSLFALAHPGVARASATLGGTVAQPPSDAEVERAKAIRLGELEGSWDDALRLSGIWTRAIALGEKRPTLDEERAELARIGGDEIRALAKADPARLVL